MKTEVIKLPEFYGNPSKDTITALEFMARIEECYVTKKWNDITTFSNFQLALSGQAGKWLSSVVRHLQLTLAQKTWTRIRPSFKTEFAAFSDDKLIIDGLANLSHRPGENPRMFSQGWRNSFTSARKITPHTGSNQIGQLKRPQEVIQKIHLRKQSMTTWTTLQISCSP
jgi:Neuraminidase (sialidase)